MDEFSIRFWGARGSIAVPGPETVGYGGETTCYEVRVGAKIFLIDMGTGLRKAGIALQEEGVRELDLFVSHFHLDHLIGLPFFSLIHDESVRINCHAAKLDTNEGLKQVIGDIFSPPEFPIAIGELKPLHFDEFELGESFDFPDSFRLETIALSHPGGCCGFKFVAKGKSICIVSDHEHGNSKVDATVEDFVHGSDIMVYDGMFSDSEYENHVGWGHSTWQEGIRLAGKAGVKQPVITHHGPWRTDEVLDDFAKAAKEMHEGSLFAREGLKLEL